MKCELIEHTLRIFRAVSYFVIDQMMGAVTRNIPKPFSLVEWEEKRKLPLINNFCRKIRRLRHHALKHPRNKILRSNAIIPFYEIKL